MDCSSEVCIVTYVRNHSSTTETRQICLKCDNCIQDVPGPNIGQVNSYPE